MIQHIWEWEDDYDWKPYDTVTSNIIENAYAKGNKSILLNHGYFSQVGGYTLYLDNMLQEKNATRYRRKIRRVPLVRPSSQVVWEVEGKPNVWAPYDDATIDLIESANKNGDDGIFINANLSIDFINMLENGSRRIRRKALKRKKNDNESNEIYWEWKDGDKWVKYDRQATSLIEGTFKRNTSIVYLNFGPFKEKKWKIDLTSMEKTSADDQKTEIRRHPSIDSNENKKLKIDNKKSESYSDNSSQSSDNDDSDYQVDDSNNNNANITSKKDLIEKCSALTNWKILKPEEDVKCAICLESFENTDAYQLSKCQHYFHLDCIIGCYQGYISCPSCSCIYGIRTGSQPYGSMRVEKRGPGYVPIEGYENCGTIIIHYDFPNGVQGENHPYPGQRYSGTSRVAYLPDNKEGNELLQLFDVAFQRKLLFRVGRSVTTGKDNTVIWNGIHMKTSPSGGATNFGFPDPTYFDRVKSELLDFGISTETI